MPSHNHSDSRQLIQKSNPFVVKDTNFVIRPGGGPTAERQGQEQHVHVLQQPQQHHQKQSQPECQVQQLHLWLDL